MERSGGGGGKSRRRPAQSLARPVAERLVVRLDVGPVAARRGRSRARLRGERVGLPVPTPKPPCSAARAPGCAGCRAAWGVPQPDGADRWRRGRQDPAAARAQDSHGEHVEVINPPADAPPPAPGPDLAKVTEQVVAKTNAFRKSQGHKPKPGIRLS